MLKETSDGTIDVIKGIIAEQKLNAIKPQELGDDADLRGGVGLESLDCLNILLTLQQHYGLQLENIRICKEVFRSPRSLAEFVAQTKPTAGDRYA